jgi:hypothetical protein
MSDEKQLFMVDEQGREMPFDEEINKKIVKGSFGLNTYPNPIIVIFIIVMILIVILFIYRAVYISQFSGKWYSEKHQHVIQIHTNIYSIPGINSCAKIIYPDGKKTHGWIVGNTIYIDLVDNYNYTTNASKYKIGMLLNNKINWITHSKDDQTWTKIIK